MKSFPKDNWEIASPEEAGLDPDRLPAIKTWLDDRVDDRKYRFAIVKSGKLAVEWNHGVERDEILATASTWKSMLSNVLGIAVAEGKLPSADAAVYDYWPDYMDVPEGTGPKDGRARPTAAASRPPHWFLPRVKTIVRGRNQRGGREAAAVGRAQ